jgi:hypothetical protein
MGKAFCLRCNAPMDDDDDPLVASVCRFCMSTLSSVLETLALPAAYVNRDLTVMTSNKLFKKVFGKFTHDPAGLRIGEAMKCSSSAKYGRCGETSLCLHCGIRRLIDLARITGERFADIPLVVKDNSGTEQLLRFSFTKAENSILVMLTEEPAPVG